MSNSPAQHDTSAQPVLRDLSDVPSMGSYLRRLWERRQYAWEVPLGEFRSQNLNTVLGQFWYLMNPLLSMAVYYFVFGIIIGTDRGLDNFLTFLGAGVFTFNFTTRSMAKSASSVVSNEGLIRAMKFPRAILPLSATIGGLLAYLPMVAVLLVIALVTGEPIRWQWLLLVPITFLQFCFNLGLGMIFARATDMFRDLQNLLPFMFRLLFYMSGVLFAVEQFVQDETLQKLFIINPMYSFITAVRYTVLPDTPNGLIWVSIIAWTLLIVPFGLHVFRRGEARYGRA